MFACAPKQNACETQITVPLAFSSAADQVTARTFGDSCANAIGVISIASEEGHVLWAWAAPLHPTFGNLFEPGGDADKRVAEQFIDRWANMRAVTTQEAPLWPERAAGPMGGAETTLERGLYEDIRARNLPMACALTGVARETCVFYEPAAAAAAPLVVRDIPAGPAPVEPADAH
ncbi:MAG: hypothetical protein ABW199_12415 [Caulobacterales bacterium]